MTCPMSGKFIDSGNLTPEFTTTMWPAGIYTPCCPKSERQRNLHRACRDVIDLFKIQIILDWFFYHQGISDHFSTLFWPSKEDRKSWRLLKRRQKTLEKEECSKTGAPRPPTPPPKVVYVGLCLRCEFEVSLLCATAAAVAAANRDRMDGPISDSHRVSWVVSLCWYMLFAFRFSKSSAF